ncbi:reverse transcriptase domain-containing protein [Tanacetum coccineum]
MPYSVWKDLALPELTPTCMTLELADRSITEPIGIAKDVRLMVGKFQFPADFVVVDFEPDPRVPLILGRCFLKTSHALIDVYEGEITLRVGKEAITFNLDQTSNTQPDLQPYDGDKIESLLWLVSSILKMVLVIFKRVATDSFLALEDDPTSSEVDPTYQDPEGDILLLEAILNSEPPPPLPNHKQYMPGARKELKLCEAKTVESSVDEPPRILKMRKRQPLLKVLKVHKRASLETLDIKGEGLNQNPDVIKRRLKETPWSWIDLPTISEQPWNFDIEFRDKKGAENLAADICPDLKNPDQDKLENKEYQRAFPSRNSWFYCSFKIQSTPWFADFANYPCGEIQSVLISDKTLVFWGKEALDILKLATVDLLGDTMVPITQQEKSSIQDSIGPPSTRMPMTLSPVVTFVNVKEKLRNVMRCHKTPSKFAKSLTSGALILWGRSRLQEGTNTYSWLLTTCQNGLKQRRSPPMMPELFANF